AGLRRDGEHRGHRPLERRERLGHGRPLCVDAQVEQHAVRGAVGLAGAGHLDGVPLKRCHDLSLRRWSARGWVAIPTPRTATTRPMTWCGRIVAPSTNHAITAVTGGDRKKRLAAAPEPPRTTRWARRTSPTIEFTTAR